MPHHLDYARYIEEESRLLLAALRRTAPQARVPSCPEWSAADLTWHIGEVQSFWATIVDQRLSDPEAVSTRDRPGLYPDLLRHLEEASACLLGALETADPDEAVWTWSADQRVGFVLRFQAHEALMHRVDAELAAGGPVSYVAAELADDGINVILKEMVTGIPPWGSFAPDGATLRVETTDTGGGWGLVFGRFTGTSPVTDKSYDLDACELGSVTSEPDTLVKATASALDLWLWGRGSARDLTVAGDAALVPRLRAVAAEATQ